MLTASPYHYIYRPRIYVYQNEQLVRIDKSVRPRMTQQGAAQAGAWAARRLAGCKRITRRPYASTVWGDPTPGRTTRVVIQRLEITGTGGGGWEELHKAAWVPA